MPLEVYFREDIANGIASVAVAMLSASIANGGTNVEYCRGVIDTSRAQAIAFGIPWGRVAASLRKELTHQSGLLDLIEAVLA